MRIISYDIESISVASPVDPMDCNGVLFRNTGDVDAAINGIPLPAGEMNDDFWKNEPGDILRNDFKITFKIGTAGTNPFISVIRKYCAVPKDACITKK